MAMGSVASPRNVGAEQPPLRSLLACLLACFLACLLAFYILDALLPSSVRSSSLVSLCLPLVRRVTFRSPAPVHIDRLRRNLVFSDAITPPSKILLRG